MSLKRYKKKASIRQLLPYKFSLSTLIEHSLAFTEIFIFLRSTTHFLCKYFEFHLSRIETFANEFPENALSNFQG